MKVRPNLGVCTNLDIISRPVPEPLGLYSILVLGFSLELDPSPYTDSV